LVLEISGRAGGTWSVIRSEDGWSVWRGAADRPAARIRCDVGALWRLFFNALSASETRERLVTEGDAALIGRFLSVRAVMV
jgi:hypothetical protein